MGAGAAGQCALRQGIAARLRAIADFPGATIVRHTDALARGTAGAAVGTEVRRHTGGRAAFLIRAGLRRLNATRKGLAVADIRGRIIAFTFLGPGSNAHIHCHAIAAGFAVSFRQIAAGHRLRAVVPGFAAGPTIGDIPKVKLPHFGAQGVDGIQTVRHNPLPFFTAASNCKGQSHTAE